MANGECQGKARSSLVDERMTLLRKKAEMAGVRFQVSVAYPGKASWAMKDMKDTFDEFPLKIGHVVVAVLYRKGHGVDPTRVLRYCRL